VPAILMINLQITTFFFVAGLILLERDEGTLAALAVSPLSASGYLVMRTFSLTGLPRPKRLRSSGLASAPAVRGGSFSREPRHWPWSIQDLVPPSPSVMNQ
jgi:hypothetical protein